MQILQLLFLPGGSRRGWAPVFGVQRGRTTPSAHPWTQQHPGGWDSVQPLQNYQAWGHEGGHPTSTASPWVSQLKIQPGGGVDSWNVLGWKGHLEIVGFQPPLLAGPLSTRAGGSKLHPAWPDTSRDPRAATAAPGNLSQGATTLTRKNNFQKFPSFHFEPE